MGNSHVYHTIEKKKNHASKTVKCMVNLCPIYGEILTIDYISKTNFNQDLFQNLLLSTYLG